MKITPTLDELLNDDVKGKGETNKLVEYLDGLRSQKTPLSESQYTTLKNAYVIRTEKLSDRDCMYFKTADDKIVVACYSEGKSLGISVKPVEHMRELREIQDN